MSKTSELLDFDSAKSVEVRLGGRTFFVRPQSAKVVQEVLEYSQTDSARRFAEANEDEKEPRDPRQFIRDAFSNWPDMMAVTTLMLGLVSGTPEYDLDLAALEKHLAPRVVMQIFEKWWEVNEIDVFFDVGLRVLQPMTTRMLMQAYRRNQTQKAMETMGEDEEITETVETPATVN